MRFFKNKFQCAHKNEILFMYTIKIIKKEYLYLSIFTIKQKQKKKKQNKTKQKKMIIQNAIIY